MAKIFYKDTGKMPELEEEISVSSIQDNELRIEVSDMFESMGITLNKEDSLNLAKSIIEHYNA